MNKVARYKIPHPHALQSTASNSLQIFLATVDSTCRVASHITLWKGESLLLGMAWCETPYLYHFKT